MKRMMMQGYMKNTDEAVPKYLEAFGAQLTAQVKHDDGTYLHAEIDIEGHIFAVAEAEEVLGHQMQFCLHYAADEGDKLKQAYDCLKEGSELIHPLGPCFYCEEMADFVDAYGIRWCLFR